MTEPRIGYQPGESQLNNVIAYLEYHRTHYPKRTALKWVEPQNLADWSGSVASKFSYQSITYGEFAEKIDCLANGFYELGIRKGDRVIVFLPMGVMMYAAMFAVQKIGAIAVFLDSWARINHLGASAECVDPKAMISHEMAFQLVSQIPEFKKMALKIIAGPATGNYSARLEQLLENKSPTIPMAAVTSEFTALITFTTGSSGKPKGANRTHRFLCAQHEALSEVIPYTDRDEDMPAFPIFSLNNLASGVTTVIPALDLAKPSANDAAALVNQLLNGSVTCATLSPAMLNGVAQFCLAQNIQLKNLRRVVTGGAPISKDDVQAFKKIAGQADLWILYGSTEVEPMAHIEGREMLAYQGSEDSEIVERGVNVGHISENLNYKFIRIVKDKIDLKKTDWSDLEVEKHEVGEFIVTGDHVCRDYYNNEEAFFQTKIRDHEGKVWHRTGDLAYQDQKGYLWVVGRVHNAIERASKYYFPVQAEIILKRIPDVTYGAYLGMPDSKLGEKTVVVLQMKNPEKKSDALKNLKYLFEKNKIPVDEIYLVEKIPMDPRHHSKVEYNTLRDMIVAQKLASEI